MTDFTPSQEAKARQRATILAALCEAPLSTIQARALGVLSPAARVMELRRAGWVILTHRRVCFDAAGMAHTCGVYEMVPGGAA